MSRTRKVTGSQRDALTDRMAEHLDNWQAQRKPKPSPKTVAYDWAKKRVVNAERATHRKCFGITGDAARDNFDRIFRR
jgi:hypothetical protein